MPPPPTVICEICHQQFSMRSLPIHQIQCVKKREASTSFCPVCECLLPNDELKAHEIECKRVNAQLNALRKNNTKPTGDVANAAPRSKVPESVLRRLEAAAAGANSGISPSGVSERLLQRGGGPCEACNGNTCAVACSKCDKVLCTLCSDAIHTELFAGLPHEPVALPETQAQAESRAYAAVSAGLEQCAVCSRRFAPDRLGRHQLACMKSANAKKRKAYPTAAEDRVEGTEFAVFSAAAAKAAKSAPTAATAATATTKIKEPPVSRWRQQHNEFQAIALANKAAVSVESAASIVSLPAQPVNMSASTSSSSSDADVVQASQGSAMQQQQPAAVSVPVAGSPAPRILTGDSVAVNERGGAIGTVQYKGPVWGLAKGTWLGIEFHDSAMGDTDGSVRGVHYFYCTENHGLFVRPQAVLSSAAPAPNPADAVTARGSTPERAATTNKPAPAKKTVVAVAAVKTATTTSTSAAATHATPAKATPAAGGGALKPSSTSARRLEPQPAPASSSRVNSSGPDSASLCVSNSGPDSASSRVSISGLDSRVNSGPPVTPVPSITRHSAALQKSQSMNAPRSGVAKEPTRRPGSSSGTSVASSGATTVSSVRTTIRSSSGAATTTKIATSSSPRQTLSASSVKPGSASAAPAAVGASKSRAPSSASSEQVPVQRKPPTTTTTSTKPSTTSIVRDSRGGSMAPAAARVVVKSTEKPSASVSASASTAGQHPSGTSLAPAQSSQSATAHFSHRTQPPPEKSHAPSNEQQLHSQQQRAAGGHSGGRDAGSLSSASAAVAAEQRHKNGPLVQATRRAAAAQSPVSVSAHAGTERAVPVAAAAAAFLNEDARARDIARSVDFLRVLAGEKSKLAASDSDATSSSASAFTSFGGKGQSLGGAPSSSAAPSSAAAPSASTVKRFVSAGGILTNATAATLPPVVVRSLTADVERERRAAAALARMQAPPQQA